MWIFSSRKLESRILDALGRVEENLITQIPVRRLIAGRVHMMRVWETDVAQAMEKIPKVELTGLDGKGEIGTKSVCAVSSMSRI